MRSNDIIARGFGARTFETFTVAVLLAGGTACADTLRSLAPTSAGALAKADQLVGGLAARFTRVEVSPAYAAARVRLSQSALLPGRVFDDTTIWTSRPSSTTRLLTVSGDLTDGRFVIESRAVLMPPRVAGETRHTIALARLPQSSYRWDTNVEYALGTATADDVAALLCALLASAQSRSERELRADYRTAFPRATTAFGRGFSIDSVSTGPSALGSTAVAVTIAFHPETMRSVFPAFADYLDRYLGPARYRLLLEDRSTAAMFDIVGHDRMVTFHYRVLDGRVVSLYGPPRPLPDTLVLKAELTAKIRMFTVGFHDLITEFLISSTGHERAWTITGHREPQWNLPRGTERLLRTPLRRPFDGAGTLFRLSVRDSAGAETVLARHTRLEVQESAIMRFVGSLAAHALRDFNDQVQADEVRFFREGFGGLQADIQGMAPTRPAETRNATWH